MKRDPLAGLPSLAFLLILLFILKPTFTTATTYYLSLTGSDTNAGTSPLQAWQSLTKVSQSDFQAGDSILLEGGSTFYGRMEFSPSSSGTSLQPISIGSYGTGRATIEADGEFGIFVDESAGYEIRDLNIIATAAISNEGDGILFRRSQQNNQRNAYILIEDVDIFGFKWGGITIDLDEDISALQWGYEDITIRRVISNQNGDHGIEIEGKILSGTNYSNRNVHISHCTAFNNYGIADKDWNHTGNGIVVGNTEDVIIEYSLAHDNGKLNNYAAGGPVGIWMWDSKNGVIQHCESHNQSSANSRDGGGFDLDGGCVNCTIQYCYSHDNKGSGYMLAEFSSARAMQNNVIRYNISENDARGNNHAAFLLWRQGGSSFSGLKVYNNTIYLTASAFSNQKLIESRSSKILDVVFVNNIFICKDNLTMIQKDLDNNDDIYFYNNVYYTASNSLTIKDKGSTYSSLGAWRSATNQELFNGDPLGWTFDPKLNNPGQGIIIGDPNYLDTLSTYRLDPVSPVRNHGIELQSNFGIDRGTRDYFNQTFDPTTFSFPGAEASTSSVGGAFPLIYVDLSGERTDPYHVQIQAEIPQEYREEQIWVEASREEELNFQRVGRLDVKGSMSTFLHPNISASSTFYRVKWTQLDGEEYFSQSIRVRGLSAGEIPLKAHYQAETNRLLLFSAFDKNQQWELEVYNIMGKHEFQAVEKAEEENRLEFPMSLPAGIHMALLKDRSQGITLTTSFMVK